MKHKRESLDTVDAEHIKEMLGSSGWRLVSARIQHELGRQCTLLESPQSEFDTASTRGLIRGLRLILEIPEILIREGKRKPGEEDRA